MGWHTRVSRFGSVHQVFHQKDVNSCGPSCALMLYQRMRGVKLDKDDSYKGYDAYGNQNHGQRQGAAVGGAYDGSAGTWFDDMARLMRNSLGESCKPFQGTFQECTDLALLFVRDGVSILGSIGWYNNNQRNGGHWIVLDRVENLFGKKYMVASDPGDGHVHVSSITKGQPFSYRPDYGQGPNSGFLDGLVYFPDRARYN